VDGVTPPAERRRHPHAHGQGALGPLRGDGDDGTARDPVALRQRPAVPGHTASVLYAYELGLVPITTPAYSPESNGLAEGFVHTFKRDYVNVSEVRDAESVLAQLGGRVDDYNRQALHSALGMRSPAEYRASLEPAPPSV